MTKKDKRPIYEPPRARDLSLESASGQIHPLGTCSFGGHPYTQCIVGDTADYPSSCAPGSIVEECSAGSLVEEQPQCNPGSMALVSCWGGGDAG